MIKKLTITNKEIWNVDNNNSHQPSVWTAITFENSDNNLNEIVFNIQKNLKDYWYVDIRDETNTHIIFPQKSFCYLSNDEIKKEEVIQFGEKIGIPKSQLDWV